MELMLAASITLIIIDLIYTWDDDLTYKVWNEAARNYSGNTTVDLYKT